jgi:hypothetical protein
VFLNGAAVAARAGSATVEWLAELSPEDQRRAATLFAEPDGAPPQRHTGAWSR